MFSIPIQVDASWITPVYEHVHHGRMLSLFEEARLALVESVGFPNEQLMRAGKVLVVTGVNVAYKREVRRGSVQVTCDSVVIDGRTIRLGQSIINERGKVAVAAQVSLMFMDNATRRGIEVPEDFRVALSARLAPAGTCAQGTIT